VHEHRCEESDRLQGWVGNETAGDEGPFDNKGVSEAEFGDEDEDVCGNYGIGEYGRGSACAVIVGRLGS
jgi:hypothetical protein